jgi:ribosomal protein S18 acetylase RimI-like enzyme
MYHITVHDTASAFLANAGPTLRQHEGYSNIILAHAEEVEKQQSIEQGLYYQNPASTVRPDLWLCSWTVPQTSSPSHAKAPKRLDIVLACTSSHMGPLPLFLVFLGDSQELVPEFTRPRIINMTAQLATKIEPSSVFSIFGPPPLVQPFVDEWQQLTGAAVAPGGPWYEARMLQCRISDFDCKSVTPLEDPEETRFRLASLEDLPAVSELCRQFSVLSQPYELVEHRATYHAQYLITHGQAWVCEVVPRPLHPLSSQSDVLLDGTPSRSNEIVSICAVTRETEGVAAITKILTHPNARRRGYAQHLLRHVLKTYFQRGKSTLVLYVGNELLGARRIYERVGFQPLLTQLPQDWVEVGFQGTQLGYW